MPSVRQRVEALEAVVAVGDEPGDWGAGMPDLRTSPSAAQRIVAGILRRGRSTLPVVPTAALRALAGAMDRPAEPSGRAVRAARLARPLAVAARRLVVQRHLADQGRLPGRAQVLTCARCK